MTSLRLIVKKLQATIKGMKSKYRYFPYISIFICLTSFLACSTVEADILKILNIDTAFQMALRNNKEIAVAQEIINKSKLELKSSSRFIQDSPNLSWEVKNREKSNGEDLVDYGGSVSLPVEIRGKGNFVGKNLKQTFKLQN